jgi:hypothetical protein
MGEAAYRRQQAEYMKQYRASKKSLKLEVEKKQKSSNILSNALRASKARKELQAEAITKTKKTLVSRNR